MAEHELVTWLSSRRYRQLFITIKGGQVKPGAEGGLSYRDRNPSDEINPITLVTGMGGNANMNVEIACYAATWSRCSSLGQTQGRSGINPCRDLDLIRLVDGHPTVATATGTRRGDHLANTSTTSTWRSRDHLAKHALSDTSHLTRPVAINT